MECPSSRSLVGHSVLFSFIYGAKVFLFHFTLEGGQHLLWVENTTVKFLWCCCLTCTFCVFSIFLWGTFIHCKLSWIAIGKNNGTNISNKVLKWDCFLIGREWLICTNMAWLIWHHCICATWTEEGRTSLDKPKELASRWEIIWFVSFCWP